MKKIALLLALALTTSIATAQKYFTKTGSTTFEASVPAVEEVKATNVSTTAIINTANGDFAALILVKGFRFKNALMEEHFNENYAESDDYPKATFKGNIANFDVSKLSTEATAYSFSGTLTFHGKTKALSNEKLMLAMVDEKITAVGEFAVTVSDFDIDIPKVVSDKLSNNVSVTYNFELKKK